MLVGKKRVIDSPGRVRKGFPEEGTLSSHQLKVSSAWESF